MDQAQYDPAWVAAHYDTYGDREWQRMVSSLTEEVSLYIHTHYLTTYVPAGSSVLEVGPGPGRFTMELDRMGCRVTVADISPVQLELHRTHAAEEGFEKAVVARLELDICDMHALPDAAFDAVVGYGGPLSYVVEQAPVALAECRRVCRPGGHVLVSVMSLWGACRRYLEAVLAIAPERNRRVTDTGDLSPATLPENDHYCHMFRAAELRALVERSGLEPVAMSAAQGLCIGWDERLGSVRQDPAAWQELLRMELEASAEPGCLDLGTHIIAVGRRMSAAPTDLRV